MQVTHRGNQRDALAILAPAPHFTAQHWQGFNNQPGLLLGYWKLCWAAG